MSYEFSATLILVSVVVLIAVLDRLDDRYVKWLYLPKEDGDE